MAVQRVEADPQARRVGARSTSAERRARRRRPRPGLGLAAALDDRPRKVRPAAIVRRVARDQLFRGQPGQLRRSPPCRGRPRPRRRRDGAEQPQASADRHAIVERRLLRLGIAGQHQHRLDVERRGGAPLATPRRGRQPRFVVAERLPHRRVMLGLVRLEIEVEDDERPRRRAGSRAAPARPAAGCARRSAPSSDGSVPVNGSPCDTMLRNTPLRGSRNQTRSCSMATGTPAGKRALDAIGPLAAVGIAVVGVEQHPGAGGDGRLGRRRIGAGGHQRDEEAGDGGRGPHRTQHARGV